MASTPTLVTIDTITPSQIRKLMAEAKAAGDELADYCKIALDKTVKGKKKKYALELCVETWNALQSIARDR